MSNNTADQEEQLYFLDYASVYRMKLVREFLGAIDGKTAVDIGCGSGSISYLLWSLGANVHSVDVSAKALRATKSLRGSSKFCTRFETNLFQADATKLPVKGEAFDIVCCLETLEHTQDDRTAIEEIARVTKPEGMVILCVPYNARAIGEDRIHGHYRRYSFETMKERLGSKQLHLNRLVFWCFPMLKLLDLVRLRYICAALGILVENVSGGNEFSHRLHDLRNHEAFVHSLTRFYRTRFWRRIALPLLIQALDFNKLFQNSPYSDDVFLISRKTNQMN